MEPCFSLWATPVSGRTWLLPLQLSHNDLTPFLDGGCNLWSVSLKSPSTTVPVLLFPGLERVILGNKLFLWIRVTTFALWRIILAILSPSNNICFDGNPDSAKHLRSIFIYNHHIRPPHHVDRLAILRFLRSTLHVKDNFTVMTDVQGVIHSLS